MGFKVAVAGATGNVGIVSVAHTSTSASPGSVSVVTTRGDKPFCTMIAFPTRFFPVTTRRNFVIDSLRATETPNERVHAANVVNMPAPKKLRRVRVCICRSMTSPQTGDYKTYACSYLEALSKEGGGD